MNEIYITGHRNPDLDSLCSASAYAVLKNTIDPDNKYIPIRCSHVSDSVKKQMQYLGLPIPVYKKDIRPRVSDVMMKPSNRIDINAPIYDLVKEYETNKPSVVPIYDKDEFAGLLSVDDITAWFLNDNAEEQPVYEFAIDNVEKVIPGKIIKRGESNKITGSLLIGAATQEAFSEFVEKDRNCIVLMGQRANNIEYAIKQQVPAIIITTSEEVSGIDFSDYKGLVYATSLGTAEAIRRMRMVESIGTMMKTKTETISADELFLDARKQFANSSARGFAVMDGDEFVGYVTRRCFLNMPTYEIIMVDHNEAGQSIDGIELANIREIIDHHRLDALSTKLPIFIAAEPLGSTCTIVFQLFRKYGLVPDQQTAKYLLTGLISDTLILKSPTATKADAEAMGKLAELAGVDDYQKYGEELFKITDNLAKQDPVKTILSDFKKYEDSGIKMGIGQCEVTTLSDVNEYADTYLEALELVRNQNGLDWTMLMVTDVLRDTSVLLVSDSKLNRDLPYKNMDKQIYSMPGVMSRKKQLLPTMLSITSKG